MQYVSTRSGLFFQFGQFLLKSIQLAGHFVDMAETGVGNEILAQRLYRRTHELLVFLLDAAHDAALTAKL